MKFAWPILTATFLSLSPAQATEPTIELDTSEVPELAAWGERGKLLLQEWYPRIANLLSSPDFTPPERFSLRLKKSERGVGATSGTRIIIFSNWIERHPDDLGLLIHELVHVVQSYPGRGPGWLTEGIADYIRWAIYEGRALADFPAPDAPDGYKQGYQPAAGWLLWLETHHAPGVVRRLNTAMRTANYSPEFFEQITGMTPDAAWAAYLTWRSSR